MTIETVEQLREFVAECKKWSTRKWMTDNIEAIQSFNFALGEIDNLTQMYKEENEFANLNVAMKNKLQAELDRIKNVNIGMLAIMLFNKALFLEVNKRMILKNPQELAQAVKDFIVGGKSE